MVFFRKFLVGGPAEFRGKDAVEEKERPGDGQGGQGGSNACRTLVPGVMAVLSAREHVCLYSVCGAILKSRGRWLYGPPFELNNHTLLRGRYATTAKPSTAEPSHGVSLRRSAGLWA